MNAQPGKGRGGAAGGPPPRMDEPGASQAHGKSHYRELPQGITPAMVQNFHAGLRSTAKLLEEEALHQLQGKVNPGDRKLLEGVVRDARRMMKEAKP